MPKSYPKGGQSGGKYTWAKAKGGKSPGGGQYTWSKARSGMEATGDTATGRGPRRSSKSQPSGGGRRGKGSAYGSYSNGRI